MKEIVQEIEIVNSDILSMLDKFEAEQEAEKWKKRERTLLWKAILWLDPKLYRIWNFTKSLFKKG